MAENNSETMKSNQKTEFLNNSTFDNFYTKPTNQSACHVTVNPVNHIQSTNHDLNDQLLPSNNEKLTSFNLSHPSTICYQTFKNEISPFESALKRSSTFAGVFNTLFRQSEYNHLLESNSHLDDYKVSNKLRNSKSYYDYETRFNSSEPFSTEQTKKLITHSTSTTSLLSNIKDLQSIKQSLLSMAVALTKHSTSNTGRIIEQPSNLIKTSSRLSIPNSLSNSISHSSTLSSSTPSPSLYTNNETSTVIAIPEERLPTSFSLTFCTLCLQHVELNEFIILENCKCGFCRACLEQYCAIIIRDHSLTSSQIICPSAECPKLNSSYLTNEQVKQLVDKSTYDLYEKIKIDLEVHLDPNRIWCPTPNCETICNVSAPDINSLDKNDYNGKSDLINNRRVPVNCKNCNLTFCLHCRSAYHGKMPCQSPSEDESLSLLLSRTRTPNSLNDFIKKCPRCGVFIERENGCAQMMCSHCKHVFCFLCLKSLEEDFLLRHYDSGSCKNKLGHSKATLLWLRFQVIAVFIGFALFLLLVSPLLLISAPILLIAHLFCNLSISTKVWSKDDYLDTIDQNQLNSQRSKSINDLNTQSSKPNSNQTDHLIDLSESNGQKLDEQIDNQNEIETKPINKHQQLIQAYIQNNGGHKLLDRNQTLNLNNNIVNSNLFEEHPIKLSGYDRNMEEIKEEKGFFSWFKWFKSSKPKSPLPRLSSMLDDEKHRKFIEELLADRLSLDNQLNSVDIDKHYMIISRSEANLNQEKTDSQKWYQFWARNN